MDMSPPPGVLVSSPAGARCWVLWERRAKLCSDKLMAYSSLGRARNGPHLDGRQSFQVGTSSGALS